MLKAMENAAQQLGLKSEKGLVAYGSYQGYTVLIRTDKDNRNAVSIHFAVCADGAEAGTVDAGKYGLPSDVSVMGVKYKQIAQFTGGKKREENTQKIVQAVKAMVNAFLAEGLRNCDEKGVTGLTDVYLVQGEYFILSDITAQEIQAAVNSKKRELQNVRENPVLGIVGAMIGSLAGIAIIFILGRLRIVSMLGGVALGFGIVLGYQKLGKKLGTFGMIFCSILAVVMTYVAFRLDAGFDVWRAWEGELTFAESIRYTKETFKLADSMDTYVKNLILMMLFGVGGAIAAIWGEASGVKTQTQMKKMS